MPGSPPVRRVELCLEEKSIAQERRSVSVGETKPNAHPARHPPSAVFPRSSTATFASRIEDVFPGPADPRAHVRMNQIIGINEEAVAAAVPMGRLCISEFDRLPGLGHSWRRIKSRI